MKQMISFLTVSASLLTPGLGALSINLDGSAGQMNFTVTLTGDGTFTNQTQTGALFPFGAPEWAGSDDPSWGGQDREMRYDPTVRIPGTFDSPFEPTNLISNEFFPIYDFTGQFVPFTNPIEISFLDGQQLETADVLGLILAQQTFGLVLDYPTGPDFSSGTNFFFTPGATTGATLNPVVGRTFDEVFTDGTYAIEGVNSSLVGTLNVTTTIPEPSSVALGALGLLCLNFRRRIE